MWLQVHEMVFIERGDPEQVPDEIGTFMIEIEASAFRAALTTDDPHGFVQADWRPHLITDGRLDRATRATAAFSPR